MTNRILDPTRQADQHLDRRAGVPSRRDLRIAQQRGERRQENHGLEIQTSTGTILARLATKIRFAGSATLAMVGDVAQITVAAAQPDTGYFTPPGPVAVDAAAVTALASGQCGARYLGMVPYAVTSVEINVKVTTAVATSIVWAEVALASANSASGGNLTFIVADLVAPVFNSTGVKTLTFAVDIPAGTFLYLLYGSSATTPFQLRATLADELSLGVVRLATARPSTMPAPTAFSTSTATTAAAWCVARWS
jgi:hypothetical protein